MTTERDLDHDEARLYPVRVREYCHAADLLRATPAPAPRTCCRWHAAGGTGDRCIGATPAEMRRALGP